MTPSSSYVNWIDTRLFREKTRWPTKHDTCDAPLKINRLGTGGPTLRYTGQSAGTAVPRLISQGQIRAIRRRLLVAALRMNATTAAWHEHTAPLTPGNKQKRAKAEPQNRQSALEINGVLLPHYHYTPSCGQCQ